MKHCLNLALQVNVRGLLADLPDGFKNFETDRLAWAPRGRSGGPVSQGAIARPEVLIPHHGAGSSKDGEI